MENGELNQRINERDKVTPSPEERAGYILNLIKDNNNDITDWDIICFCSEYLGAMVINYNWLEVECIQLITRRVQTAHYTRDEIPESGVK